jgi:CheY-like chemotaxis protein
VPALPALERESSSFALAEREPGMTLLVADDEPSLRALLATRAGLALEGLTVLEAEDGAAAVQIGLQQRPQLALLDVQMPRLGGLEAAVTLRELQPNMRIALCTARPDVYRDRARELGFPLFDKLDVDRAMRWLELQARAVERPPRAAGRSLRCSVCGYGVAGATPPPWCPMCQRERNWVRSGEARRPPRGASRDLRAGAGGRR